VFTLNAATRPTSQWLRAYAAEQAARPHDILTLTPSGAFACELVLGRRDPHAVLSAIVQDNEDWRAIRWLHGQIVGAGA
jgi:hypothetical protein